MMEQMEQNIPLCVDLDGTLLKTDTLHELIFRAVKQHWWLLFILPFLVFKGKAQFKKSLADKFNLDPSLLPYNTEFLSYLKQQKEQGRTLILVTGCYQKIAVTVAEHTGLFDDVYATNEHVNLTGKNKARLLVERFGDKAFDYAGNASVDTPVWAHSRNSLLVNCSDKLQKTLGKNIHFEQQFDPRPFSLKTSLKAIRLHQWAKNALIFTPALTAHGLLVPENVFLLIMAFLSFGCCASFNYIINDLLDLEADRKHHTKQHRPFAAGTVSIQAGLMMGGLLLILTLLFASQLPTRFILLLLTYFITTNLYSFYLKSMPIIDVTLLAGLYTLRVMAGAVAIHHEPSFWLIAFSAFLFFSLAIVKRLSELLYLKNNNSNQSQPIKARGYVEADINMLQHFGSAAAIAAIMVLALYIDSPNVRELYNSPRQLWLLCPIMLVWLGRVWLITGRGKMHDDPVVFALKDRASWLIFSVAGLVMFSATFH